MSRREMLQAAVEGMLEELLQEGMASFRCAGVTLRIANRAPLPKAVQIDFSGYGYVMVSCDLEDHEIRADFYDQSAGGCVHSAEVSLDTMQGKYHGQS